MPIIVKKPKPVTEIEEPVHDVLQEVADKVENEIVSADDQILSDLDTVRDAQKRIANRKPSASAQAELKTIADMNAIDAQFIAEATERLLAALVPANHPPDVVIKKTIAGRLVEIGKLTMKRTISDAQKAAQFMGDQVFWGVVTIPLKAIDDYLTKPQRDEVIETTYTGKRSLTVKSNIETEL